MAKRTLSKVPTDQLQHELNRRMRSVSKLVTKRDKLASELNNIEAEIAKFQGNVDAVARINGNGLRVRGVRQPRPKNTITLLQAIEKVLKGKTLSVTEITDAVQVAGYKTNAENFRTIVNQTLIKNEKQFKKVARGQYKY